MIRRLTILVVVLMATCVAVCAQAPSPTPKNSEEGSTGTISGKVVNENGQPLIGAAVFARSLNSSLPGRRTATDLEGTFRLNDLDPGLYSIMANAAAYTTEPGPPVYYRLGDSVRVEMVRGGVITGVVTNALGEPVIKVSVRATRLRDAKGETSKGPQYDNVRTTDDRGIYRIYGLLPGTYLVSAGGGGELQYAFNPYNSDIATYAPSSTRDTAVEIIVRPGEESTADIRYKGEPGYTISGNVKTAAGNGAQVSLKSVSSGLSVGSTFQLPGNRGFAFSGLADGEYSLVGQEYSMTQTSRTPQLGRSDVKRITVKGANITGIELIPKPVSSISGRITLERTKAPGCEGKRPPLFAETAVQTVRHEKDSETDDDVYARTGAHLFPVDENGAFVVRALPPARYQFEPRFYARYWYTQSITMNTTAPKPQKIDAAATWTALKSGEQLTNVIITLAEGAASIRGRLELAEGAVTPAGRVVYLIPAEPDKAEDVLRFSVTEVASDGAFTLNNLPPGKYLAVTQTNVDAQIATLTKLRQPEAAAARTKLRRTAEAQKTDIELKPCQNLVDYQLK
ncbi:MAG TPA: carboxypeptidase-like regulatory domain-containing protein [Pyrinomonadaceae bacterium]